MNNHTLESASPPVRRAGPKLRAGLTEVPVNGMPIKRYLVEKIHPDSVRQEKYIGQVLLGKTYTGDFPNNKQFMNDGEYEQFLMKDAHEPIIELEKYKKVQEDIKSRSNVEIVNGAAKRKNTHYSSKRKKPE